MRTILDLKKISVMIIFFIAVMVVAVTFFLVDSKSGNQVVIERDLEKPQSKTKNNEEKSDTTIKESRGSNLSNADIFSIKSDMLERISKLNITDEIQLTGIGVSKVQKKVSEPFISLEEFDKATLDSFSDDIYINGRQIISPDSMIIEKFVLPGAGKIEHTLSVAILWNSLNQSQTVPEYWLKDTEKSPKWAQGTPDGIISLFFREVEGNVEITTELQTVFRPETGDIYVTSVSMIFGNRSKGKFKRIISEIGELCGLKTPVKTGSWIWRSSNGVPSDGRSIKNILDAGIVKWIKLSSWDNNAVFDGNIVTWNGILTSMELVVDKDDQDTIFSILSTLSPLAEKEGFVLSIEDFLSIEKIISEDAEYGHEKEAISGDVVVSEDAEFVNDTEENEIEVTRENNLVKIIARDSFVINFSMLWD
ncbi:hypothetical protein FACS1894187_19950 [Synergistales bacterium]|nr:hypothetical protein FACS1894187_19950 [Synergistales bacterium]